MTIGKLKNRALSLARLSGNESEKLFYYSFSAALHKIYSDISVTESRTLYIQSSIPKVHIPRVIHRPGEEKTLPLLGRAYSLYLSGKGQITLRDGSSVNVISFDSECKRLSGFIDFGGDVKLSGNGYFEIQDYCLFSDIRAFRKEDIPYSPSIRRLDFSKYPDFLFFTSMPTDDRGHIIPGSSTVGGCFFLPSDFSGNIRLTYRKKAPDGMLTDSESLPLPPALEPLVLPLVLAYMLTDEDEEASKRQMKIYESLLGDIKASFKPRRADGVLTNGWA